MKSQCHNNSYVLTGVGVLVSSWYYSREHVQRLLFSTQYLIVQILAAASDATEATTVKLLVEV